jgi:hypothetical protein
MNKYFLVLIFMFAMAGGSAAVAQGPLVIQQKIGVSGDGPEKDSSIQYFKSNRALVQMGLSWVSFDPATHSKGYKLTYARNVQILSPALPKKCAFISVYGFLNGMDGYRNFLSLALKGKECKSFTEALIREPLSMLFYDVPALDDTKPPTELLRLDIVD